MLPLYIKSIRPPKNLMNVNENLNKIRFKVTVLKDLLVRIKCNNHSLQVEKKIRTEKGALNLFTNLTLELNFCK